MSAAVLNQQGQGRLTICFNESGQIISSQFFPLLGPRGRIGEAIVYASTVEHPGHPSREGVETETQFLALAALAKRLI